MSKLHLVFGGRVKDPRKLDFADPENLDVVGIFPDYKAAEDAWRAAAQKSVDDAENALRGRAPAPNAGTGSLGFRQPVTPTEQRACQYQPGDEATDMCCRRHAKAGLERCDRDQRLHSDPRSRQPQCARAPV